MFVVVVLVLSLGIGSVGATDSGSTPLSGDAIVSIASHTAEPDDDEVVVRFDDDDDYVVTGAQAENVPKDHHVRVDHPDEEGDKLVVSDGTVETESGKEVGVDNNSVRVRSTDPDLVVTDGNIVNSSLIISDNGTVVTEEGNSTVMTEDGEDIVFPEYDDKHFQVEVSDVSEGIGEGETLDVTTEFENIQFGDGETEVNVTLIDEGGDDIRTENANISLDGGESNTTVLEYETEFGDSDATDVEVSIPNESYGGESSSMDVTIYEAMVYVDIVDHNDPAAGDDLEVEAEIDRRGTYPDGDQEYMVDFKIDGSHVASESVTLGPGDTTTETFTYETSEDDSPSVDVEVSSEGDDMVTDTVDVLGEALLEENLEVNIIDRNWPDEGDDLVITGEIGYADEDLVPDQPQEYPIEFFVDGDLEDNATVELDGSGWETEEFVYETQPGDAPRVDVDLESPGTGDSAQPRVNGSGFDVEIVEIDEPVNESETMTTIARIENTGDVDDEQDVRMRIDSAYTDDDRTSRSVVDNETVSLTQGGATTERFTYRTDGDDVPMIEVAIISDDDEALGNATVRDSEPRFDVHETSAELDDAGEELTLSAAVNNTGLETDEQYVEFIVDDEVVYIDRLELGPWEEQTVTSTVDPPETAGTYDFSVTTDDVTEHDEGAVVVEERVDEPDADEEPDDDVDDDADEDDEPADADEDEGLSWFMILLGVLGVAASVLVLLVYRNDPENFPPDAATAKAKLESTVSREALEHRLERATVNAAALVAAIKAGDVDAIVTTLKHAIGLGSGTLVVQNELPRETLVRIRCQTADDTVLLEDLELGPNERRTLGSLPSVDQFKVGAGVEDITAHEEVFQGASGDVGVVLRPEGILIANLG